MHRPGHHRAGRIAEPADPGGSARRGRADAEQGGDERRRGAPCDGLAEPGEVAVVDVRRLVRDDADDLARRLGGDDRAGVDEHPRRVDDEGVEALVDDEEDLDVAGLDVGLLEDRRGVVLEQRLGLGVAGDVDAGGERRLRGERRGKQPGGERTEPSWIGVRLKPARLLRTVKPGGRLLGTVGFRIGSDSTAPVPGALSASITSTVQGLRVTVARASDADPLTARDQRREWRQNGAGERLAEAW